MSIPTYRQEQEEFLESLMEMLTLSGYKPKIKEDYPAIQIKLKEMNDTKLLIFANPENFTSFTGNSFSKKLEVRYKNVLDKYECMIHFTGDLELVEGWETLVKYDEFVDHQHEGGLMDGPVEEPIDEPSFIEKLIARREENLPGGFVMMSTAEVMASRRSAYDFAF